MGRTALIKHIVIWTLKDPADARSMKALLDGCKAVVPGILEFEVGIRTDGLEANADVVLYAAFEDKAALAAYQAHPHHQAVGAQIAQMRQSRVVVDYEP